MRHHRSKQETLSSSDREHNPDRLEPAGSAPVMQAAMHNYETDTECSSCAEEADIVFCFEKHGEFDILKSEKSETPNICRVVRLRPINRKLIYREEDVNITDEHSHECLLMEDEIEFDLTNEECEMSDYQDENEDEESIYLDPLSPSTEINREELCKGDKDYGTIFHKLSFSDASSRSSFAFPVLGRAWSGSPIKMPNSAMRFRKDRCWRLGLNLCCRF